MWDKCLAYIDRFLTEASRLLTRSRGIGNDYFDDGMAVAAMMVLETTKGKSPSR